MKKVDRARAQLKLDATRGRLRRNGPMLLGAFLGRQNLPRRRVPRRIAGRMLMNHSVIGIPLELLLGKCAHLPSAKDLIACFVSLH